MGKIAFVEFVLPHGSRREVDIAVTDEVQKKADALREHGLTFTTERLRTGDVVYYITDDAYGQDADICIVNAADSLTFSKRVAAMERMILAFDWEKYKADRASGNDDNGTNA